MQSTDNKGKLLKGYHNFYIKKYSSTKYTVKLAPLVDGRIPGTMGNTYTFTRTKKSPASLQANMFSAPVLRKQYTDALNANVMQQYKDQTSEGKNVKDPRTDPEVQDKIKSTVKDAVDSGVTQIIQNFNYNL